ncbi:30S ribosomal protein S6 alpha, chloroplastic [Senna tora]|uniref:30S ribosomal protein S6 alpha, chloroplastic n=1 Tax=Senna tora TaxID=362788 RepID=A0A834TXF6_9FABA|nr:30S ribosomal protein S6 alpha, chloroplastic [Senna tora]
MALSSLTSPPISSSCFLNIPNCSKLYPTFLSSTIITPFFSSSTSISYQRRNDDSRFSIRVQTLELSGSFFEGGFSSDDDTISPGPGFTVVEDKEEPQCPPGLGQYEVMAVLRPDMSEDDRLALTQKYEELLVAGGGMYIEVFNRGVIRLAYSIKKKNKAGETNTYLDGIYLVFTFFTNPESMEVLEDTLKADDDVIRSMSFKVRKRKY